ncbi:MAG: GAF domain-containing sensor histidine kinase [Gemmatimonadaceae bacterium]|nr:GAF domain-containing sensor histidine kinase [Gemmatimonadaceae bacterium]
MSVIPAGAPTRLSLSVSAEPDPVASVAAIEALYECARAAVHEPDPVALASALAGALARVFHADDVLVGGVVDGALTSLARCTAGQLVPARAAHASLAADEIAFIDWALVRRQSLSVRGGAALPTGAPVPPWSDVLVAPALHHQGQPVAILLVARRRRPTRFASQDLRVLETVAQQAAVAFDRAHLLVQLHSWARGLEALFKFSAAVSTERDPARLVRDMAEHAARLLKADGGHGGLAVAADADEPVQMVSTAYWCDGEWREQPRVWARGSGIPGLVLDTEFPYLSNDYAQDGQREQSPALPDVAFAVAVPIKNSTDEVLGFFELHRRPGNGAFSWQDAAFLESVANMTAVAIENARLGTALHAKNQEVRALSARHVSRLEEERQHIARELHDEAGQALVGVKLSLQAMSRLMPRGESALQEQLDHLRAQVNDAATRLKVLARRLRPPTLDRLGLDKALQQLAHESEEHFGFAVRLSVPAFGTRLPAELETALFRISQEALTNVAAHAEAGAVEIRLEISGTERLRLTIADDGVGFDPASRSSGLGLLGMRERVGMLGGAFALRSVIGEGTTITVEVPFG